VPFPSDIRAAVTNQNALSSADLPLHTLIYPGFCGREEEEKRKRRGGEEEYIPMHSSFSQEFYSP
jgi:hypothetical protein